MNSVEWITENDTGDLVMVRNGNSVDARIPKAVVEAASGHDTEHPVMILDRLKLEFERELNGVDQSS